MTTPFSDEELEAPLNYVVHGNGDVVSWCERLKCTIDRLKREKAEARGAALREAAGICARWANECDHSDQKAATSYADAARFLERQFLYMAGPKP